MILYTCPSIRCKTRNCGTMGQRTEWRGGGGGGGCHYHPKILILIFFLLSPFGLVRGTSSKG